MKTEQRWWVVAGLVSGFLGSMLYEDYSAVRQVLIAPQQTAIEGVPPAIARPETMVGPALTDTKPHSRFLTDEFIDFAIRSCGQRGAIVSRVECVIAKGQCTVYCSRRRGDSGKGVVL